MFIIIDIYFNLIIFLLLELNSFTNVIDSQEIINKKNGLEISFFISSLLLF
jgi:hypothetical protein